MTRRAGEHAGDASGTTGAGMSLGAWITYLTAISAMIASPGPSALMVVRTSSHHGMSAALRAILGGSLSALIMLCVSLAGLARLAGDDLLGLLRLAGGGYLVYCALRQWRQGGQLAEAVPEGNCRAFLPAFLVGMSNPKDILFFSSFLSLLVPQNGDLQLYAQVVFAWVLVDLLIMLGYAWIARRQCVLAGARLARGCAVLLGGLGCVALLAEAGRWSTRLLAG